LVIQFIALDLKDAKLHKIQLKTAGTLEKTGPPHILESNSLEDHNKDGKIP
jgi:hypothetical protein